MNRSRRVRESEAEKPPVREVYDEGRNGVSSSDLDSSPTPASREAETLRHAADVGGPAPMNERGRIAGIVNAAARASGASKAAAFLRTLVAGPRAGSSKRLLDLVLAAWIVLVAAFFMAQFSDRFDKGVDLVLKLLSIR